MSVWLVIQVILNIVFLAGMFMMWARLKRPPQDDPRLSRGLQLLQSKISVLEDLSDRTEVQVKQLTALLEQKCQQIQRKIEESEVQVHKIEKSMQKSLEIAEIFQDKIPHEEIIERQSTLKYVRAAEMAHGGATIEEIMEVVDLPRGEIEFIAKVNRDELMFDKDMLPSWAQQADSKNDQAILAGVDFDMDDKQMIESATVKHASPGSVNYAEAFNAKTPDMGALESLGQQFRQACEDFENKQRALDESEQRLKNGATQAVKVAQQITSKIVDSAETILHDVKTAGFMGGDDGIPVIDLDHPMKPVKDGIAVKTQGEGIAVEAPRAFAPPKIQKVEPEKVVVSKKNEPVVRKVVFPRVDPTDNLR